MRKPVEHYIMSLNFSRELNLGFLIFKKIIVNGKFLIMIDSKEISNILQ